MVKNYNDPAYRLFRLKTYLCYVYGEIEGYKKYLKYAISSSKKMLIFKHGRDIGERRYQEKIEKDKFKNTLPGFIQRYGEEIGTQKYYEKNKKLSVGYNSLKNKGLTEQEIQDIKSTHAQKSKQTKENFIKRHGEEGIKKFDEYVQIKKEQTLKNCKEYWLFRGYSEEESQEKIRQHQTKNLEYFQTLYGIEEGKKKYLNIQKSKGRTKEQLITQFGIDKALDILQKRTFHDNYSSKTQIKFAEHLYENLTDELKDDFMGAPYNKSFIIPLNVQDKELINQKIIVPDIKIKDFIIEYDGEYWHQDEEKDRKRDIIYQNRGYTVIRIKEGEYMRNKKKIINDIILKLKGLL